MLNRRKLIERNLSEEANNLLCQDWDGGDIFYPNKNK